MRNIAILFIMLGWFSCQESPAKNKEDFRTEAHHGGYIQINGKTNINAFTFLNDFEGIKKIDVHDPPDYKKEKQLTLEIPVTGFRCSNSLMKSDFLELLQYEQHPHIQVAINQLSIKQQVNPDFTLPHIIEITIAGVTRQYLMPLEVSQGPSDNFYVTGTKKISITDFNLSPPKNKFGFISVKNEVNITFGLLVKLERQQP